MIFKEETISSEMIYKGAILNLRRDKVTVKGNKTAYREIIEHNGAVAIVALTKDNKVIMVRQYRKACEKAMLEIPAGKIDKGEDPFDCAVRELKEETGYTAGNTVFLTGFYTAMGYSTEKIYLYLCTDLTPGETDFDEDEAIDITEVSLNELCEMCTGGKIEDAKTIVGALLVKDKLERGELR